MPPQYMTVGVQQMALKNMPLWYIDYFELWALENRKCRERLPRNCPYQPKDISQNECSCHKSSLWEFHHLAKIGSYHWRGDYKLTPYPDSLSQTVLPPICYYSKGPSIFFTNHLLSPTVAYGPPPLSLVGWHLSLNSKPPRWVTYFPMGLSLV